MSKSISSILTERMSEIGIDATGSGLEKLELLPAEAQDFICRWDLRGLSSVEEFWKECRTCGVLNFDSYLSEVSTEEFPVSLILGINKVLTISKTGRLSVYSGLPSDSNSKEMFAFYYCMFSYAIRCNDVSCYVLYNAVQTMIRKAFWGNIAITDSSMHHGFSGMKKFLTKVVAVFASAGHELNIDWNGLFRHVTDNSSAKSYESILITDRDMIHAFAGVQISDNSITVTKKGKGLFTAKAAYDDSFESMDLTILILALLERVGITYDDKERRFIRYDDGNKVSTAGYSHEFATDVASLESMIHVRLLANRD